MKRQKHKERPVVSQSGERFFSSKYSFLSLLFGLFFVLYMIWPGLNPLYQGMFSFHDPTQPGRVTSFVQNLQTGHIPPRLAPEYSFHLGMPVFNFYAPTAYWITSVIALFGFSSSMAVKISFLLAVCFSFVGMYFFLNKLFVNNGASAALVGATVYVSSTYFATEVMVRGNLSETWFLALLPFALGLIIQNSQSKSLKLQVITTLTFALLFTTHNMMMLFAVPIVCLFLLFFPEKRRNIVAVLLALLIDSYFLIPAFMEGSLVQATSIAKEYNFQEHFLCAWQLWTAKNWDFGGSLPGCDADTMSFKIGKTQVILGLFGAVLFYTKLFKNRNLKQSLQTIKKEGLIQAYKNTTEYQPLLFPLLFISFITVGALSLTLSQSQFIWTVLSPVMSLFQFPWRFIVFGMFGFAVFAGYLLYQFPTVLQKFLIILLLPFLFLPARKYFIKPMIPLNEYEQQFNSEKYLSQHIAFKIPEYIVSPIEKKYWRSLEPTENTPLHLTFDNTIPVDFSSHFEVLQNDAYLKSIGFYEPGKVIVNIHYFPFWKIYLNGSAIVPHEFDNLARPILHVEANDRLDIRYEETQIEKIADYLSLFGFVLLICSSKIFFKKNIQ